MDNVKKRGIFEFILGIVLVICAVFSFLKPIQTFMALAYIISALAIIKGAQLVYIYFKIREVYRVRANTAVVIGILLLIAGIIFLIKPEFASNVFSYLIAIWFIYDSVNNFLSFSILKRIDMRLYFFGIVTNLLMMAGGILIIVNPLVPQVTLSVVMGITFLLSGIEYMIFSITGRNHYGFINTKDKNTRVK